MKCEILDLGLVRYNFARITQSRIVEDVKTGKKEAVLILAEFFPVYTMGRRGSLDNLLVSLDFLKKSSIDYYEVERGGDITFHNPGQLVIYPIFSLALLKKDLNWYLRSLEEVIIKGLFLAYGIQPRRKKGFTGVYVENKKIASIGIAVSKWVTSHGISLNVNNDLSFFGFINPCGIKDCKITSLSELIGGYVDIAELKDELLKQFENIFGLEIYASTNTAVMA